jgi:hypothetical protein
MMYSNLLRSSQSCLNTLGIYKALIDALKSEGGPNIQYSHLLGVICNHPGIVLVFTE